MVQVGSLYYLSTQRRTTPSIRLNNICSWGPTIKVVQETLHPLFFLAPHAARALPQFSDHHELRQYRVLHACRELREQDPVSAHNRLGTFTSLHEGVPIGNRVGGAIIILPTDAASQEPALGSAQRVVVAHARVPRGVAVSNCLEYLDLNIRILSSREALGRPYTTYLFKPPYAIGSATSFSGHAFAYRWRSLPRVRRHRAASKSQGSSKRVLPRLITVDQFMCTSLSHTHYWHEVGMLKAPALYSIGESVQCIYRLLYVLDNNAAIHNTSRRTDAGRLITLCTYLQPWRGTARGLVSFRTCITTRIQLEGRNLACKQYCASGLQHLIYTGDVTAVRRTLQRSQICSRDTIASSTSGNHQNE